MDRHEHIQLLAKSLKAEAHCNELNKALTHVSYTAIDESENNSRFVFLGQYAFRGYAAEIIYKFTLGTGTQLQHILGNMFKNENLQSLFDKFKLKGLVRCNNEFDYATHKHIFVFGLLGFIHLYSPDEIKNNFVSRNFILPNRHLFDPVSHNNDFQAQCNFLSRTLYQEPVYVDVKHIENKLWETTVTVKDCVLACETSVSYRYSRQKTLKKALKILADDHYFIESSKPEFNANQGLLKQLREEKIQLQKEEKLQLRVEKEVRKRTENKIKKEKLKAEKEKTNKQRLKAKAEVAKKKESRKGKNTIYREYTAEEIAAMSTSKRRRLEDLGILAKQK